MNRYAKPSNFGHPIRTPLLREHFVYRTYNAAGELLYIGCSRDWQERLRGHRDSRSNWVPEVASVRIEGPYNYETARQVEYDAIESERSLYNYSSERRAIHRLRDKVIQAHLIRLMDAGLSFDEAMPEAREIADTVIPYGGRSAMRIDDLTVPAARRVAAEHLGVVA